MIFNEKSINIHDYIVIGAGAAGSIVAAKLAARNASVLLLEAGEQAMDPRVWDPQAWYEVLVEDADIEWGFQSVPQEDLYCPTTDSAAQPRDDGSDSVRLVATLPHPLNRGAGTARVLALPQAKVVGGCSLHNAMVYVRGARSDYDRWAALGLTGWDWGHVLPYFEEVEGVVSVLRGERNDFIDAMIEAAGEVGLPFNPNYNTGSSQFGAALLQFTISKDLTRETSYSRFNDPPSPNLTLQTGALVTRIRFDSTPSAIGVEYLCSGQLTTAFVRAEVILCAGAINSPKILMLSGIGEPQALQSHGIPVVANLPPVGRNFHDDLYVTVAFSAPRSLPPQPYGLAAIVLFGPPTPDLGTIHTECSVSSGTLAGWKPRHRLEQSYYIWPNILHLQSTGSVTLQSSDPSYPPLIDPGYLKAQGDIDLCREGLKLGREIGHARALAPWRIEEVLPGSDVMTDEELATYIRCTAGTTQHYVGSCRMGSGDDAVVDHELKVRGVVNLRVIDASIVPSWVTGNTAAVSMMIGARGVDFVLPHSQAS